MSAQRKGSLRRLSRATRGSVITEFAFSALTMIFVLMMTVEFGLEVFLRQSSERAAGAAAIAYADTRDPGEAQDAAAETLIPGFRDCLEPLDISLYDNISSMKNGTGRHALNTPADDSAVLARVTVTCRWERLTPIARIVFGPRLVHDTVSIVRIRQ